MVKNTASGSFLRYFLKIHKFQPHCCYKIYSYKNERIYKGIVAKRLVRISLRSEVVYFTSFVNVLKIIKAFEHCITD